MTPTAALEELRAESVDAAQATLRALLWLLALGALVHLTSVALLCWVLVQSRPVSFPLLPKAAAAATVSGSQLSALSSQLCQLHLAACVRIANPLAGSPARHRAAVSSLGFGVLGLPNSELRTLNAEPRARGAWGAGLVPTGESSRLRRAVLGSGFGVLGCPNSELRTLNSEPHASTRAAGERRIFAEPNMPAASASSVTTSISPNPAMAVSAGQAFDLSAFQLSVFQRFHRASGARLSLRFKPCARASTRTGGRARHARAYARLLAASTHRAKPHAGGPANPDLAGLTLQLS
jgi:hypothetical protein